MKKASLFILIILGFSKGAFAAPEKLTREFLLKNSPVPERRVFQAHGKGRHHAVVDQDDYPREIGLGED